MSERSVWRSQNEKSMDDGIEGRGLSCCVRSDMHLVVEESRRGTCRLLGPSGVG